MSGGEECLLRWRIRAVISRRVAAAACANNDKSQLDRALAPRPHRAPVTMLMFRSIDATRCACAVFYAHFSTILYRIVPRTLTTEKYMGSQFDFCLVALRGVHLQQNTRVFLPRNGIKVFKCSVDMN